MPGFGPSGQPHKFNTRDDFDVTLVWRLQNMGLGDLANLASPQRHGLGAPSLGVGQSRALVRLASGAPTGWLAATAPERRQGATQHQ